MKQGEGRVETPLRHVLRFYVPAAPLAGLVTSYHLLDTPGPLADYLHPETGNIRFALRGNWAVHVEGVDQHIPQTAGLYGPTDRTSVFSTQEGAFFGVGLTPLGWARLIDGAASAMANRVRPLGFALGLDGDALGQALIADGCDERRVARLDRVLTARLKPPLADDALIAAVSAALMSNTDSEVATLAAAVDLTERRLHRICLNAFGFTPKRLLMRQRFFRTLGAIRDHLDQPLSQVLDGGYYDQAHFIRDFRAYMGMTPSAWFSLPREVMRRAEAERLRVIGAPMQVLHGAG